MLNKKKVLVIGASGDLGKSISKIQSLLLFATNITNSIRNLVFSYNKTVADLNIDDNIPKT